MEAIDWSKPIEMMNAEPREHWVHSEAVWVGVKGNHVGFYTDLQGCIGGVQVVRNRKEPEKHEFAMWVNVRVVNGNHIYSYYNSRTEADMASSARGRIACLHIMKEFVEGEGI